MFVLFDARVLQTASDSPAGRSAAALLEGLRSSRPGWDVRVFLAAERPVPAIADLPAHAYAPPLPDSRDNRRINELHLGDWIAALGPDAVMLPDVFAECGVLPRFTGPAPRVIAGAADPAAVLPRLNPDTAPAIAPGVRAALRADAVLTPRPDAEPLFGRDVRAVDPTASELVRALETPPAPTPQAKPRIAWVSPAPPAATGVADYALEVAEALAERFDVEWVLDPKAAPPTAAVLARFRTLTADEYDDRHAARPFDLPVYHLGNNHFHTYQLPLMRRHPGLVVAHDTHTGGLFIRSNEAGVWPGDFPQELDYNGETLFAHWVRHNLLHPHTTPTLSAFNRRPFEGAAGLLVHSAYAWRTLAKVSDAPASIVPLIGLAPTLGTRAEERKRLGIPADRFVVASLGIVSEPKRPAAILRAAAALPPDVRERVLVLLVGPPEAEIGANLDRLAAELGMADRFRRLGRVPLEDFPAYAFAADVCVQLRYPCNGETSAALVRALAAGAACVVSDTGAMAEIPNAVALKVRSPALDVPDLTAALTRLARDPDAAERLREAAKRYMHDTHRPELVVAGYAAAVSAAVLARGENDGPWRAAVANALADRFADPPPGLIEALAETRAAALARGAARVPATSGASGPRFE